MHQIKFLYPIQGYSSDPFPCLKRSNAFFSILNFRATDHYERKKDQTST